MEDITVNQAQAFLNSLWPCGEHSHLSSHTRTYLEALVGFVPTQIYNNSTDIHGQSALKMADVLVQIAERIKENVK